MSRLPRRIWMERQGGILVSVDRMSTGSRLIIGCGMIAAAIALAAAAIAAGLSF